MNACSSELGQFREVGHHGSGPSGTGGGSSNLRVSSQPAVRKMASQTRFFFEGVAHAQGEVAQEKQYSVAWIDLLIVLNPPACRRVLWTLFVLSCSVCLVFSLLSRFSPWRGFLFV